MPFKSEAQHKKFRVLLSQKKITPKQFNEWMGSTKKKAKDKKHPLKELPERIKKASLKEVAAIAVKKDGKILMGKRKDSGKMTNPGGHLEEGETPVEGAIRELKEETGIEVKASDLKFLKTIPVKDLTIHGFVYNVKGDVSPTMTKDPDDEVFRWRWVDPAELKDEDLHVERKNNVLASVMPGFEKKAFMENSFIKGFLKIAGGPGSGVTGDNTKIIKDLETSPLISIGYRSKFMSDHKPMRTGVEIKVSKIKFKGQEKCVPKKLNRMIAQARKDDSLFEKPIKVLRDDHGYYHILDGHHRALAAIRLKREMIMADVYVINGGEKKVASKLPKRLTDSFMKILTEERENPQYLTTFGYDSSSSNFKGLKKRKKEQKEPLVRDNDNLESYS